MSIQNFHIMVYSNIALYTLNKIIRYKIKGELVSFLYTLFLVVQYLQNLILLLFKLKLHCQFLIILSFDKYMYYESYSIPDSLTISNKLSVKDSNNIYS